MSEQDKRYITRTIRNGLVRFAELAKEMGAINNNKEEDAMYLGFFGGMGIGLMEKWEEDEVMSLMNKIQVDMYKELKDSR